MYLLDTNICIYLIKNRYESIVQKIQSHPPYSIGVSSITVAELEYGIAKSKYPEKNRLVLLEFLSAFELIPFTLQDAQAFGVVREYLRKNRTPIGPYDMQLAAQCLSRDLTLVTHNVDQFKRVHGLKFEDWVKEADI